MLGTMVWFLCVMQEEESQAERIYNENKFDPFAFRSVSIDCKLFAITDNLFLHHSSKSFMLLPRIFVQCTLIPNS